MRTSVALAVLAALHVSALAAPAAAEQPAPPAAPSRAQAAASASAASAPAAPRRDPKGITGVSPLWEAIAKADAALVARDFDGAIVGYREAITKEPQSALAHYRMGEAQKLKGDLAEAQLAYEAALRFAGDDASLKSKALFCLADLAERKKDWERALTRWAEYETLAASAGKAKVHPASAAERKKRILEWQQNSAASAEVKARIEKRLRAADESAQQPAK